MLVYFAERYFEIDFVVFVKCALKKSINTCGDCPELDNCQAVRMIISNNPVTLENLKG